jgi:hypothetical protein
MVDVGEPDGRISGDVHLYHGDRQLHPSWRAARHLESIRAHGRALYLGMMALIVGEIAGFSVLRTGFLAEQFR